MPVLDDAFDTYRFRGFTLRAVGEHIEVWVQQGVVPGFPATTVGTLDFPAGDCRNDGVRNVVTNEQIASLIHEFDTNIYPKESATFSVPPTRNGTEAQLPGLLGLPDDYYIGDGDKIVTLISNVEDTNYYDRNNAGQLTYIAGFFSSQINAYFDRKVMNIDAFDWTHRTGPNRRTTRRPTRVRAPRPGLISTRACSRTSTSICSRAMRDPGEVNWVNEGLSDWAQTLVGYVDPALPITDKGFDSHISASSAGSRSRRR